MERQFDPDETNWMDEAACKGLTHLFFPALNETPTNKDRRVYIAKSVCKTCAVVEPCNEWAKQYHEYGIWGGIDYDERFVIIKRRY